MEEFVNFLLHYYREIILGFSIVLEIVILCLKKTKINYELPSSWYPDLVKLVSEAESIFGEGHGKQKLNYVIEKMSSKLNLKYYDGVLRMMIEEMVNLILSTPTKKGGPGRDEEAKS